MHLAELARQKSLAILDLPNRGPVQAEVTLAGFDSIVVLHDVRPVSWGFRGTRCLTGRLTSGARLSLINCFQTGEYETTSPDGPLFSARCFPQYIAVGACHVTDQTLLHRVHLKVQDAGNIFFDADAFGSWRVNAAPLASLLADHPRPPKLGERPRIAYFSGRERIFERKTAVGTVSATNCVGFDWGGPNGTSLSNRVLLTLEPDAPCAIGEMMERVHALLRFLHIVAGRRQIIEEFSADLAAPEVDPVTGFVEIYWSAQPRESEARQASPHDMPLHGAEDPDRFGDVLERWLDLDKERWVARARFCASAGRGDGYTADRLVAAANVFDILPKSALPRKTTPDPDFAVALREAKAIFAALPESEDRASALNALGRITRTSLKHKVQHRASVVLARAGAALPQLAWVLGQAVNARNFYVHGSSSKEDRSEFFQRNLGFFTDALEFTFMASELVDAGGDFRSRYGTTGSHPLGAFVADYQARLKRLQRQVS